MKFKKYLLGLLLLLFLGMVIFLVVSMDNSYDDKIDLPEVLKKELANMTEEILLKDEVKNEDKDLFLVTRVVDGDTIEIEGGLKVRYIGVDTPETVHPNKEVECFGVEASNQNKFLVEGKMVRLEKDITDMDRYGRLLRYVYVGDVFVNLKLVQDGYAKSYTYAPDVKYQELFLEAQQKARSENKGLWGGCGDKIVETEKENIVKVENSGDCNIKGNINSVGEKIYHLPNCASYNQTKIDEIRGEKWFCTEKEAVDAGWVRAKNC